MFRSYFKIAWRTLIRKPGYTIINVLGLAVGMACFILIILYVKNELGYDNFHENADRIYRMSLERIYPGRSRNYAIIPHSFSETVKSEFPEVEESCRVFNFGQANTFFKKGGQIWEENSISWADSTFFTMFDIPLLRGDKRKVLSEPNAIILTESMAKKYFGTDWRSHNIIGEVLDIVQNDNDPQITGVCADVPDNSHFEFDFLRSSGSLGGFLLQPNYINFSAYTYLLLAPGSDPGKLESKFPDFVTKYVSGPVLNQFGVNYAEYQQQGNGYRYFLQPITSIYLDSNLEAEIKPPGSKQRIYFFIVIALLIIAIACINFMNLATARSTARAREVGIRKTLGSDRGALIRQFLMESTVISILSAILAFAISIIVLPAFNELTEKSFTWESLLEMQNLGMILVLVIITGLLAGAYPAFFLSSFEPLEVLRAKISRNFKGVGLRNALVVFQFSISIFLIAATLMVNRQLNFVQNKALGFDKESMINLQNAGGFTAQEAETMKKELLNLPGVMAVGGCSNQPGSQYFGMSFKPSGAIETTTGSGLIVDEGYVDCMEMELVAGRSFSEEFMDTLSVMVNEAAVREMGITDPVGKKLISNDNLLNPNPDQPSEYTIVGVIKDFHFQSMHHVISPLFLVHNQRSFNPGVDNLLSIRLAPGDVQGTLQQIETLWANFQPDLPFRFAFMDREWTNLYAAEITSRKVFSLFSILAIFVACLGLLALASYMTEQRIKEIGIRKVLGASVSGLMNLLTKDFIKLVLIAILIATPLAWYFIDSWLQSFAYRSNISWWIFGLAGSLAILIAWITVSLTTLKAALMTPIKSLDNE